MFTRENSHRGEFHTGMTFRFRIAFTWWLGHFISSYLKVHFMLIKYTCDAKSQTLRMRYPFQSTGRPISHRKGWFLDVADHPNDVTFSLFCVSHYYKVQVFIQPLQILISENECKISVGLSVPTNSLTTFNLIKRQFNWHEPTNRQLTSFVGLSVPTNSLTNFD